MSDELWYSTESEVLNTVLSRDELLPPHNARWMLDAGGIGVVVGQRSGAGGIGILENGGTASAQLWVVSGRVEHACGFRRLLSLSPALFSIAKSRSMSLRVRAQKMYPAMVQ